MTLTILQINNFNAKAKPYKRSDGNGLYIQVNPDGSKYWRLAYRYGGKQKTLALGVYPNISLSDAREQRQQILTDLSNYIDPSAKRRSEKLARHFNAENTFEVIAREWHDKHSHSWTPNHSKKLLARLKNDVFPWLGSQPITEITPQDLHQVMCKIADRGALDSAHRTLQTCGQIFRYAVVTGRTPNDISIDLKGALPPVKKQHYTAITKPDELAPLLRDMREYTGSPITRTALAILPYVFVRSGELRRAEWSEINFDDNVWVIPAHKMKMRIEHIVPLSKQVIQLLNDLYPLTKKSTYIFHGMTSTRRPMSENTILAAIRNLGYPKDIVTPHGFRATARTLLDEILEIPPHLIEHQLAHAVRDANGRAYNRTKHLEQRREMMQVWANYLDDLVESI